MIMASLLNEEVQKSRSPRSGAGALFLKACRMLP